MGEDRAGEVIFYVVIPGCYLIIASTSAYFLGSFFPKVPEEPMYLIPIVPLLISSVGFISSSKIALSNFVKSHINERIEIVTNDGRVLVGQEMFLYAGDIIVMIDGNSRHSVKVKNIKTIYGISKERGRVKMDINKVLEDMTKGREK